MNIRTEDSNRHLFLKEGPLHSVPIWQPIALFGFITLLLIVAGILFTDRQSQSIRAEKFSDLKSIAELKVGQIVQWRSERLSEAQINAENPFIRSAVNQWLTYPDDLSLKENIVALLELIKDKNDYQNLFLASRKGQYLLSSDPNIENLDYEEEQLAILAIITGVAQVGDFYRNQNNPMVFLNVAAPIRDEKNQPVAVLLLQVDPERYLYPLIQSWPTPSQSAETLLICKDGESALFLNTLRHYPAPPLTLSIPLTNLEVPAVQAIAGRVGQYQGPDYRGVEVLSDLVPVPGSPWFMIAKVDTDEILAEVHSLGFAVLLIVVLSVLITGMLAYFIFNNRQRRLYEHLYQAEREQREAQEETNITLYSIGDGVITTDHAGNITRLNHVAEKLTGWNEAEARGKPLTEVFRIINEYTRSAVENPVARVLREGLVVELANHTMLIARDGTERPIADSGAPIRDENNNILGVVLVFRDQTEERAAQKELAILTYAINNSLNEIYLFEAASLKFRYANQGGLKNLGYSLKQLRSITPMEIKPAFNPESFQHLVQPLYDRSQPALTYETIHRRADGSTYPVEVHLQLFEFEGDQVFLSVVQDITDRKQSEEALRKSERLFHGIFEHANDAIHIDTPEDQIIQVNQRMCEMMGYSRDELLKMHIADLQAPEVRSRSGNVVNTEFMLHGDNIFEALNLHRDGHRIPLEISVSRVESAEGNVYISIMRDITERKQTEARLKDQLEELRRWQNIIIGRESRVIELKQEVNELLVRSGSPIRYTSFEEADPHE